MKTHRFFDNTGGMNLRQNDLSLADNEAEEITNMHATARGSWSTLDAGYVHLNGEALASGAPVSALYEYVTLSGQSYMMAAAGGTLYAVEPGSGATDEVTTGLDTTARPQFVTFNGLLIFCNGSDAPKKWSGTGSVADLDGWAPSIPGVSAGQPALAQTFANRLVFSGDAANPSMLYLSELENPENFTPASGATSPGAIQVSPGDGERVTALKTLFLPVENEEVLVIFKERSTYLLTGNDADSFTLQKLSDEFGAVSQRSVVLIGNQLMFLSHEGITALSTATAQGNLTTGFISGDIHPQVELLNAGKLADSHAVHLRTRQEIWWFVADGSSLINNLVLVYNYGVNRAWSQRTGIKAASGVVIDGKLYTGNYAGVVQQQLKGNTYDGEPIPWVYRTRFYDFNMPHVRKRIREVAVHLKQLAALNVTVNMAWDFQRGTKYQRGRTLVLAPDQASSVYNISVFGESEYSTIGSSLLRFVPDGSGKFFQLEFRGESTGKPVEIEGWTITTIEGGSR